MANLSTEEHFSMPTAPNIQHVKVGNLNAIEIRHGDAKAVILEQGAHLISYGIDGENPVIWCNPHAVYEEGTPVRGGIPVCWPWFGDIGWNPSAVQAMCVGDDVPPFHGLVRNLPWTMGPAVVESEGTSVTFTVEITETQYSCWPHHARVSIRFTVGKSLTLEMTTENLGGTEIAVGQALHTYYAVSDVELLDFVGLRGLSYYDVLNDWKSKIQVDEPRLARETTNAYTGTPSVLEIQDSEWKRKIVLSVRGSQSAILWNPWRDRSLVLDQFDADAWKEMVCLETARIAENIVVLSPLKADSVTINISTKSTVLSDK